MRITKRLLAILLATLMILGSLPLSVFAADSGSAPIYDETVDTELSEYLLYETTYVDNTFVGATARVTVYADTGAGNVPTDERDVLVYVMNWNGERFDGTQSDVEIVESYITAPASVETRNKFLVVVLDYGYSGGTYAQNSVRGVIENSVGAYRLKYFANNNSNNNKGTYYMGDVGSVKVNNTAVYFLPEGYRVERDILFWESDYHSSLGTLNSADKDSNGNLVSTVVNSWNVDIADPTNSHGTTDDDEYVYYDYYVEDDAIPEWEPEGTTVGSPKRDKNRDIILYDPDGDGKADSHIAPKVSRPEDCVRAYFDANGNYVVEPLDYNVRLDIIHPAFAEGEEKIETPVVMVAGTQSHRMDNQINGVRNYLGSFLFGGYTGVVYDYAYVPTARQDHYGYNDMYGTHSYNAAKWSRAAVRCVRYYAETFGYSDDLIGVMGISKGTPTASTLSVNHNELVVERSTYSESQGGTLFEGRTEGGIANLYQPFSQYENGYDGNGNNAEGNPVATNTKTGDIDSNVTVAYAAAGDGIDWQYQDTNLNKHIAQYGTVPMVLSCGASDPYGCYKRWFPLLEYKAANANAPYLAMQMEDKGHEYPNGIDPIRDYDRATYFYEFFDMYLLPDSYAPSLVYITPKDGLTGVAYNSKIEVQLMANTQIDISEIEKNVTVKAADGTVVKGSWTTTATAMSNLFTFTPDRLEINTEYTVTVSKSIKDKNGVALKEGKTVSFTTEGIFTADPIEDTYVSEAEPNTPFVDSETLVIDPHEGKEKFVLLTYDSSVLEKAGDVTLVIPSVSKSLSEVAISVIDGYEVSEDTTYNSVKSYLETAEPVSNVSVGEGELRVGVIRLLEHVTSDKFTVVIKAGLAHYYEQNFDSALNGLNVSDSAITEEFVKAKEGVSKAVFRYQPYAQYYDYSVGGAGGTGLVSLVPDAERGNVAKFGHGKGLGYDARYRFYDSIVDGRVLTEADIGRTFKVTFSAAAEALVAGKNSVTLKYGLMQPVGSARKSGDDVTLSVGEGAQIGDVGEWTSVSHTIKITKDMIVKDYVHKDDGSTSDDNSYAMFAILFNSDKVAVRIDNLVIEEIVDSPEFASKEGAERSAFLVSYSEKNIAKPYSDTYVSTLFPDKNYGGEGIVRINSGENTNIGIMSISTEAIGDNNAFELQLPVIGDTSLDVNISLIEGLIVDETTVTYNNFKDTIATAETLGEYTLREGTVKIDLSDKISSLKEHNFFTLIIEAADEAKHVYKLDFEELDVGDTVSVVKSADVATQYYAGEENYIGISGYNHFSNNNFAVSEENGNKYITVTSKTDSNGAGASRISFFNMLSHGDFPEAGVTYTYTVKARLSDDNTATSANATLSLRDAYQTDPNTGKQKTVTYTNKSVALSKTAWTTITLSRAFTADEVSAFVRPMLAIDLGISNSAGVKFDIDYVTTSVEGLSNSATIASAENSAQSIKVFATVNSEFAPVADAYVSKRHPDKNFGDSSVLMVTGGEDEAIALASFSTLALNGVDYLSLNLPVMNDAYVPVEAWLIENYCIDENTVTYNSISEKLATKVPLGKYTLREGLLNVDLTDKLEQLKQNSYFTIVITADTVAAQAVTDKCTASSHMLNLDFEEYEDGQIMDFVTGSVTSYYDGDGFASRGYNNFISWTTGEGSDTGAIKILAEENGNKYATVVSTKSGQSRLHFYNSFTCDDSEAAKGKTYTITAKVRLAEGYTSGNLQYGVYAGTSARGDKTVTFPADGGWVEISTTYTLTAADLTATNVRFAIVCSPVNGKSVGYDIDDIRIVEHKSDVLEPGAFIASADNKHEASKIRVMALNSAAYDNKVIADAYVVQGDGKSYGTGESLTLTGKEGANAMIYTTFMTSTLEGKNYLKLPAEGICDGQEISVAVIDNVVIDEDIFNYNQGQVWVKDYDKTKFVGRYTLNKEAPYIDVSDIKSLVSGGVFTLVMQADQKHEYSEDFDSSKTFNAGSNVNVNRVYDSTYILRQGSDGSVFGRSVQENIDNDTNVFHVQKGGHRFKFYNSISYDDVTVLDMYREYEVSMDVRTTFKSSDYPQNAISVSLKSAYGGNGIATGPSIPSGVEFTTNASSNRSTITIADDKANTWIPFTCIVSLDDEKCVGKGGSAYTAGEAAVRFQTAMLTIDTFKTNDETQYLYFDNIKVTEIGGNEGVTTSTFASRESGNAMYFVTFNGADVTLDEQITVLTSDVALGDTEGTTDIFFVLGDKAYSLLSADNATGEIFFTKDGVRYDLCDSYGTKYVLGDKAVTVAAVYDNTSGTVRFAVGNNLAYYMDGETVVNTYGTVLVAGGDTGSVKVGAMYENSGITASEVTSVKAKSETPTIIGTQTKYIDLSVRIVSGIDMLYYSGIGYIAEYGDNEPVTTNSRIVFSSIEADDKVISATEIGYNYISTLVIDELDKDGAINGKTFTVTPVAYVDDVEIRGEAVTYRVNYADKVFSIEEVTSSTTTE